MLGFEFSAVLNMGTTTACILSICLLVLVCTEASASASTLRFVHVVWRHGDRTPAHPTFRTDTGNGPETWPEGLGELTSLGMRQQHALGSFLRRRYIDAKFLSPEYHPSEIFVRSSDYNRTIASALVNLAAFYPPSMETRFNEGLPWVPIPVHSVPLIYDYVVAMERQCPSLTKVYGDTLKSAPVESLELENYEFMEFMRNVTGLNLQTVLRIAPVFDVLHCEKIHNRTWPSWVTPAIYKKIELLFEAALVAGSDNPKLQRLKGGPLFREIALRSLAKASKSIHPPALKYYAYSGHDATITALLKNFGAFDGRAPPYTSAVLIELHEKMSGRFVIKTFYINETGSETPFPIAIKNCGFECDLNTFVSMARNNTPENWYMECGLPEADSKGDVVKIAKDQIGS